MNPEVAHITIAIGGVMIAFTLTILALQFVEQINKLKAQTLERSVSFKDKTSPCSLPEIIRAGACPLSALLDAKKNDFGRFERNQKQEFLFSNYFLWISFVLPIVVALLVASMFGLLCLGIVIFFGIMAVDSYKMALIPVALSFLEVIAFYLIKMRRFPYVNS